MCQAGVQPRSKREPQNDLCPWRIALRFGVHEEGMAASLRGTNEGPRVTYSSVDRYRASHVPSLPVSSSELRVLAYAAGLSPLGRGGTWRELALASAPSWGLGRCA